MVAQESDRYSEICTVGRAPPLGRARASGLTVARPQPSFSGVVNVPDLRSVAESYDSPFPDIHVS